MKERIKDLTVELSDILQHTTAKFFINRCKKIENVSEMLDLILSSHTTNIINLMRYTAKDHPGIEKHVNIFIEEFLAFLQKNHELQFKTTNEEIH